MLLSNLFRKNAKDTVASSRLYDNKTFYCAFERDLRRCKHEALIECPFLATRRLHSLLPVIQEARMRGVRIVVNTKDPCEQEDYLRLEAERCVAQLQVYGVQILFTGKHHRKLAMFDRRILWEGSLNILSQNDSCEIMRRIESQQLTIQMMNFIKIDKYLSVI